jgi:hypothetical protein
MGPPDSRASLNNGPVNNQQQSFQNNLPATNNHGTSGSHSYSQNSTTGTQNISSGVVNSNSNNTYPQQQQHQLRSNSCSVNSPKTHSNNIPSPISYNHENGSQINTNVQYTTSSSSNNLLSSNNLIG